MARGRSHHRQRDTIDIASPPLLDRRNALPDWRSFNAVEHLQRLYELEDILHDPTPDTFLSRVDDGRRWHPMGIHRPAVSDERWQRAFVETPARKRDFLSRIKQTRIPTREVYAGGRYLISFKDPTGVITCIRRRVRREVYFALKLKKRKGGGGGRRYRPHSFVRC